MERAQIEELVQNEVFKATTQVIMLEKTFNAAQVELDKRLKDMDHRIDQH